MTDEYQPQAPDPGTSAKPESRHGLATTGVVLVAVGAVLLLAQFVPDIRWWAAWPLVIIAAGFVQAVTPGSEGWGIARLLEGLATVAFGAALLAWTTGVAGPGFIGRLLSLWPVLIVAAGFDLLGKALRSQWIKALGSLAVIVAIAYAVGVSTGTFSDGLANIPARDGASSEYSEAVNGVSEATLKMDVGVAGVHLGAGDDLISVQAGDAFTAPEYDVRRSGRSAEVRVNMGPEGVMVPGTGDASVDARVSDKVLWDMAVVAGVSEFDADLSGVNVRSFELKPGVASCGVRLGDVPEGLSGATLDVKSGIASVSIELPEGVEAQVTSDSGLTGHSIAGDFESVGNGVWQTPGFEHPAEGVWIIRIKSGIGSIDIDTY